MSDEIITPQQSRGARAMLGWTREQLAEKSRVSPATLADFEAEKRTPYERTLADVRRALEDGGIEFIPQNGGGAGVRLKHPSGPDTAATPASKPAAEAKTARTGKARQRRR